jgi:superfamily II DNA or RNA helicase
MILNVRSRSVRVADATLEELDWLDDYLAIDVPSAKYSPAFKRGNWDGKKRFFNRNFNTFLTGLLESVIEGAANDSIDVELADKRRNPFKDAYTLTAKEWYKHLVHLGLSPSKEKCQYQAQGVRKILSKDLHGVPWMRGIVQLPTGSGKTFLAGALLWTLGSPRTLILCNRLDLLHQTAEVLTNLLQTDVGIIGGGNHCLEDVTIATVQSILPKNDCLHCGKRFTVKRVTCPSCKRSKAQVTFATPNLESWLMGVKVLIVDECHKVGENTYDTIIQRVPAYMRLGLSATPLFRNDPGDLLLVGATGGVIYKLRSSTLVKRGLLARTFVKLIYVSSPTIDTAPIKSHNAEVRRRRAIARYRQVYGDGIVHNDYRNQIIASLVDRCLQQHKPTMVLVKEIEHGHVIFNTLREHGVTAHFLHGTDDVAIRRKLVKRFTKGEIKVLLASTIFDEAVDIPNIRVVILCGGGNSPIKAIQRVGRGMRAKEGENVLEVYDFLDGTHELLAKNSAERRDIYEQQGFDVSEVEVD